MADRINHKFSNTDIPTVIDGLHKVLGKLDPNNDWAKVSVPNQSEDSALVVLDSAKDSSKITIDVRKVDSDVEIDAEIKLSLFLRPFKKKFLGKLDEHFAKFEERYLKG